MKDYEDSLDDFDQALHFAPEHTLAYLNRSRTLICLDEYLEAIENIEYAFSLDSECCDQYFERYIRNIDDLIRKLMNKLFKVY